MNITEALCHNLRESGIDASINTEKKSLLSQLKPFGAKSIDKITIRGRQVDGIELFGHYQSPNERRFGAGARSTLEAIDVDYILRGDIKGKKKLLEAKLNIKRTGLVHRKVVEMRWEGGTLADKLNGDSTVTDLLWQSLGQLSARDIEVKLDEDGGAAIIHVRDDRHVLSHKLPPFQLYEKIAEHICTLTGTQKSVQPLSPQEAVAAEAAPKPPENKYCPKCGENIPQDSSFCPICGATIEATTAPAPPLKQQEPPAAVPPQEAVAAKPVPPPKQPEPPLETPPQETTHPPPPKQRKASKATAPPKAVVAKPAPSPKQPEPPTAVPPQEPVATKLAPAPKQPEPSAGSHPQEAVVAKPAPSPKQPEPPMAVPPQEPVAAELAPLPKQPEPPVETPPQEAVVTKPAPVPKPPEPPMAIPLREVATEARTEGIACKKCGRVNPTGSKLCRWCGNKLEAMPLPAPVPEQPEPPTAVPPPPTSLPCSQCGHQNNPAANFCAKCGAKLEAVSRPKFCPKCGDPIAEDENFCDNCGAKLETVSRTKFCPKCGNSIAEGESFCDKCGKKLA